MPAFAIASFFPQALEMLYKDSSITITQKNTFKELARKDLLEAHVRSYVRLLNGEYLSVSDLKRKFFVKITWPNELWIAQVASARAPARIRHDPTRFGLRWGKGRGGLSSSRTRAVKEERPDTLQGYSVDIL